MLFDILWLCVVCDSTWRIREFIHHRLTFGRWAAFSQRSTEGRFRALVTFVDFQHPALAGAAGLDSSVAVTPVDSSLFLCFEWRTSFFFLPCEAVFFQHFMHLVVLCMSRKPWKFSCSERQAIKIPGMRASILWQSWPERCSWIGGHATQELLGISAINCRLYQ